MLKSHELQRGCKRSQVRATRRKYVHNFREYHSVTVNPFTRRMCTRQKHTSYHICINIKYLMSSTNPLNLSENPTCSSSLQPSIRHSSRAIVPVYSILSQSTCFTVRATLSVCMTNTYNLYRRLYKTRSHTNTRPIFVDCRVYKYDYIVACKQQGVVGILSS